MIAKICDGAVSIDEFGGIANRVVPKPTAIIILIEYPNPAWYEF